MVSEGFLFHDLEEARIESELGQREKALVTYFSLFLPELKETGPLHSRVVDLWFEKLKGTLSHRTEHEIHRMYQDCFNNIWLDSLLRCVFHASIHRALNEKVNEILDDLGEKWGIQQVDWSQSVVESNSEGEEEEKAKDEKDKRAAVILEYKKIRFLEIFLDAEEEDIEDYE